MPQYADRVLYLDVSVGQKPVQIVHSGDRLSPECNNHVSLAQPRPLRRAAFLYGSNNYSGFLWQVVKAYDAPVQRRGLRFDAYVRAPNASLCEQPARDEFRSIDPDRETQALSAHDSGRVDADDLSVR